MKQWISAIVVVVSLVALAFVLRQRDRLPKTPEAAVSEFFDAAERGDDVAYLRLVSGELHKSLQKTRAELGAEAFRESLKRSAAAIKGLAVFRSDEVPLEGTAIDVEIVFENRKERQRVLLKPQGNGWVIARIGTARVLKSSIPYGTPVFEEEDRSRKAATRGRALQSSKAKRQ